MGTRIALLYGLASYAAGLAATLYLIGFSGNLYAPTSVDVGRTATWLQALPVDLLLLGLFGMQHSVMARKSFKRWWTQAIPNAVERSTFVLATSLVLAVLFWQWRPIPEPIVWKIDHAAAVNLLAVLFWIGWVLVLVSTFLINHFELFGLQQVFARFTDRELPAARFKTPMLYRHVRHPLYLGLLLGFWSVPRMSLGHLLLSAGTSAYIFVGIWFEERDLIVQFGERYRRYRRDVGMLLPRISRPR